MDVIQICVLFLTIVLHCDGLSLLDQLTHIQSSRFQSQRRNDSPKIPKIMRRFSLPGEPTVILGAPSYPHHLPSAEPILPGHTLIRPAVGMLKSSLKFPHREQEDGSGVYGHFENIGIKYGGRNERVLYTGFRRLSPQSQYRHARRSMSRNMEMYPPKQKKKQRLNRFREPEDSVLGQVILIKRIKEADLLDIFRIIKSLRRDQESESEVEETKKLYVPGKATYGDFSLVDSDSVSGQVDKTAAFWKTKNAFNHIKISPDAPDQTELTPADTADKQRNWWFYHQMDSEH